MRDMAIGLWCRALAVGVVVATLSGCSGLGASLEAPEGNMVCSLPESVWFGANVQNLSSRPILH